MSAATRDPQTRGRTAATAAGVGFPLAFLIAFLFPDMEPATAVGFTSLLAWLVAFIGSTARDWIHEMETSEPPQSPGFLLKKLSRVG